MLTSLERRLGSRARTRPPRWLILAVVFALFVGAAMAVRSLPDDLDEFQWWPILAIALATLPSIALNGCEYGLSARIGGTSVGFREALRVALYGTAANLLPIPGASIVRIEALRRSGAGLGRATGATAAVGLCWLGVSLLLAGLLLVSRGLVSLPFLGAGFVSMIAVWVLLHRGAVNRTARSNLARLIAIEVGFVAVGAFRLGMALVALGSPASPASAFTLGVSNTVAAAIGFLPGGLGLREAIAGALGPLVGLEASTAFLAAVIERAVSLVVVAMVALVVLNLRVPRAHIPAQHGQHVDVRGPR